MADSRDLARPRVLLDTNLWSYAIAYGLRSEFVNLLRESGVQPLIAPASLLEVADTNDEVKRAAILRLLADREWRRGRLAPEVAGEASELVELVRAAHPEWMRSVERPHDVDPWMKLWTREVYESASEQPAVARRAREFVQLAEGDVSIDYLATQKENADRMRRSGLLAEFPHIVTSEIDDDSGTVGVPAWTYQSAHVWWFGLFDRPRRPSSDGIRNTRRDWTSPFLNLDLIRRHRDAFFEMWHTAPPSAAPRNWLRWASEFVQLERKLKSSNAIDNQLTAYLVDADVFLTADKGFAHVLETIRGAGLIDMATTRLVEVQHSSFLGNLSAELTRAVQLS